MIEAETETAEIPIKKTAQVVLAMGSTSHASLELILNFIPKLTAFY